MMVDRLPEAQAELERALELSPAATNTKGAIADVLILQGRTEEALDVLAKIPDGYRRDGRLAIIHAARGKQQESDVLLARMQALARVPDYDTEVAFAIAEVHASRNAPDLAFDWLERARSRTQR